MFRTFKYMRTTLLVLPLFIIGEAQTRNDFQRKYKEPAYEIRPNVWMTAKFDGTGQTCELIIKEQTGCRAGTVFLMSDARAKELLNELVPEAQRGKLINHSEFAMDCCNVFTEEYDNVTVNYTQQARLSGDNSYSRLTINWKHRKCKVE